MLHHVIVSFDGDRQFDYRFAPEDVRALSADNARQWFDREFVALECDLPNPIGKVLLADLVLSVAQTAGERRFREQTHWAEQFAKYAAALLGRSVVRIDVARRTIDY